MARYDTFVAGDVAPAANRQCGQSDRIIYVSDTTWYKFTINGSVTQDFYWTKTTNGGITWAPLTLIKATTMIGFAVWYDRWTPGDTTGVRIHLAYMESATSDVFYNAFDVSDDTLDGEVVAFAGASFSAGANSCISITKTREPKVIIAFDGDGGTETGTLESVEYPPTTTPFTVLTDINEATSDYYWLAPGNEAGTDEFYAVFFDRSAGALTLKYGNGGAAYTEVALGSSITNVSSGTVAPQMALTIGSNSHTYVVWWTNQDNAAADLNFIDITTGASIAAAVKILDSSDDQGGVALAINTTNDDLYVFYLGKTDGSDTAFTSMSVNYRVSTDDGATWGSEVALSTVNRALTYINASLEFANGVFAVAYGGAEPSSLLNIVCSANVSAGGGGVTRARLPGGLSGAG